MKKKIVSLALVASLLALVIVGGTLAYFTDSESAENVFLVGNVNIELTEDLWKLNEEYDESTNSLEHIQPGITYDKNPTVFNIGANNAYVRVNVALGSWSGFSAAAADQNPAIDVIEIFGEIDSDKWLLVGDPAVDEEKDIATYSFYYIYDDDDDLNPGVLAPGADTGALFTTMTIPASFTNEHMSAIGGSFSVLVTADAIQADTFTDIEDAFEAFDEQI